MKYDVLIWGGGLTGCLTAIHLANKGMSIAIIDKNKILSGASLHNAGGIYLQTQHQAGYLGSSESQFLELMVPLLQTSRAYWIELEELLATRLVTTCGGVIVATNQDEAKSLRLKNKRERNWGIETVYLEENELKDLLGPLESKAIAACHHPLEGFIQPQKLSLLVKEKLKSLKVTIFEDQGNILPFKRGEHFIGSSKKIFVTGKKLVSCLGAFSGPLLTEFGYQIAISQLPIQMIKTYPTSFKFPFFMRYVGGRLSVKQLPDDTMVIGGGWPAKFEPQSLSGAKIDINSIESNWSVACSIVPALAKERHQSYECGIAAWTPDGLPILGELTQIKNLYIACGGNGISLAPLYARCLSDLACGEDARIKIDAFSPDRWLHQSENFSNKCHVDEQFSLTPD